MMVRSPRRVRRKAPLFCAAAAALAAVGSASAAPVDFGTFTGVNGIVANTFAVPQWTSPTEYNGHTLLPGQIALEPTNADTTLFYGPSTLSVTNKIISGDIYFGGDDDHLGLAFGVKPSPNALDGNPLLDTNADYLLLQWKGVTQNFDFVDAPSDPPGQFHNATAAGVAPAGLSLSRVRGIPTADEFWQRADLAMNYTPPIDPPPADPGGLTELGRGLVSGGTGYGPKHSFEIHYTPSNIKVFVDGALEFDVNAPPETLFPDGTFALYEQAQSPSGAFAFFDVRDPGEPAPGPRQSLFPIVSLAAAKISIPPSGTNPESLWAVDQSSAPPAGVTIKPPTAGTNVGPNVGDVDFQLNNVDLSAQTGVMMATVRQVGLRHNGDASDARYSSVEAPWDSGFTGNARIGAATFNHANGGEWNTNIGLAYFPYARFKGGYVTADGLMRFADKIGAASPYVLTQTPVPLPSVVKFANNLDGTLPTGLFFAGNQQYITNLQFTGKNALTDGLLFVISAANEDNFVNAVPLENGSWNVAARDADSVYYAGPDTFERDQFAFVYLEPTDVGGSVGGRVTGLSDAKAPVTAQTWGSYTLQRAGKGLYTLAVEGGKTYTIDIRGHHLVGDLTWRDVDNDADGVPDARTFTDRQDLVAVPVDSPFSFAFIPFAEGNVSDGVLLLAAQDPITLSDGTVAPLPRWMAYEEGRIVQWTGGGATDTSWDSAANWDAAVPSGPAAAAYLLGRDSNAGTVSLGASRTLGTLRLENPNSFTLQGTSLQMGDSANHGTIEIVEGSHTITAPVTFPSGLTINGAVGAGTLTVPHLRGNRLNLNNASVLIASNGTDSGTSLVNALFITPGSRLDLNNNALAIDHALPTPPATSAFPEALLRTALSAGYNDGAWDGQGIASLAAKNDPLKITAIGSAPSAAVIDFAGGVTADWNGVTVDDSSALLMYTYYGDSNLSGVVDAADYLLADRGFLSRQDADAANDLAGWLNGDYNYDGLVNISDFFLMDRAHSMQGAPLSGSPSLAAAAVPEPAALLPLVMGTLTALTRRRRRNP